MLIELLLCSRLWRNIGGQDRQNLCSQEANILMKEERQQTNQQINEIIAQEEANSDKKIVSKESKSIYIHVRRRLLKDDIWKERIQLN